MLILQYLTAEPKIIIKKKTRNKIEFDVMFFEQHKENNAIIYWSPVSKLGFFFIIIIFYL